MKNVKNFNQFVNENFDESINKKVNLYRTVANNKVYKFIGNIASVIEDLQLLNINGLKQTITNKSGSKKITYVINELQILKDIMDNNQISFQDLYQYGFDSEKILDYLNSDDTIEYINEDPNLYNRISDLDKFISFLEDYNENYFIPMKK